MKAWSYIIVQILPYDFFLIYAWPYIIVQILPYNFFFNLGLAIYNSTNIAL